MGRRTVVGLLLLVLAAPAHAHAQSYLREMPTVKQVRAKVKGVQRQHATLTALQSMSLVLQEDIRAATPAEAALRGQYNAELQRLQNRIGQTFNRKLRATFFSRGFRSKYAKAFAESEAAAARGRKLMETPTQPYDSGAPKKDGLPLPWWGYILAVSGILIVLRIFIWAHSGGYDVILIRRR